MLAHSHLLTLLTIQEKHKHELDALKSSHASSLATQAADYQILVIELDNNRVNIEQLKKALDIYQQKEVKFVDTLTADCLLLAGAARQPLLSVILSQSVYILGLHRI